MKMSMEKSKRKILVTGGAGYIGSHTIIELLEKWDGEVVSIDHFANSDPATFARIELIIGKRVRNHAVDLCDRAALDEVLAKERGVHGVIHFAAFKSVPELDSKYVVCRCLIHGSFPGVFRLLQAIY